MVSGLVSGSDLGAWNRIQIWVLGGVIGFGFGFCGFGFRFLLVSQISGDWGWSQKREVRGAAPSEEFALQIIIKMYVSASQLMTTRGLP